MSGDSMKCVIALVLLAACSTAATAGEQPASGTAWVFVGTYTGAKSKGIYRLELDLKSGKLSNLHLAAETPSPSFLAIHPTGAHLYAVGETGGKEGGTVSAFALDRQSGGLKFLNRQSSQGGAP